MTTALAAADVARRMGEAVPDAVVDATERWVTVRPDRLLDAVRFLRDQEDLDLHYLTMVTAVDRLERFEMVYLFQSLRHNHDLFLKAVIEDRENPTVPSLASLYKTAVLQEREVYDLFGIRFEGHPDLRRLFLWEGFPGYPLRKDFLQVPGHHPGLERFPKEFRTS
jgi:NADH-quinone oxidoreductase subunit C